MTGGIKPTAADLQETEQPIIVSKWAQDAAKLNL
jgi:hypothetical protein